MCLSCVTATPDPAMCVRECVSECVCGRYEGQFALGLEHGMGKKTFTDLSVFEGRFRFGVRDGPGVLTHADGKRQRSQGLSHSLTRTH